MIRVVGTLNDVTEERNAQERLLHDAVHDNLTGLPNRELFFDRLEAALIFARMDKDVRPTSSASTSTASNRSTSRSASATGDSILLTIAHRLTRLVAASGHSGAHFRRYIRDYSRLRNPRRPRHLRSPNSVRRSLATPVRFTDREIGFSSRSASRFSISRCIPRAGHAAGRRDRDAPRQALGRQSHRSVPPGDARAALRPPDA